MFERLSIKVILYLTDLFYICFQREVSRHGVKVFLVSFLSFLLNNENLKNVSMDKPTKRKSFRFLRSYFDVLNQIPDDSDKLQFLLAIINKQFLDEDPDNLSVISKLSYESQRHSVETAIKGYKDKMKTDLLGNPLEDPTQGGGKGGTQDPSQQYTIDNKQYTIDKFKKWAEESELDVQKVLNQVNLAWDYYEEKGWKDKNGNDVKNINLKIRTNWLKNLEEFKPKKKKRIIPKDYDLSMEEIAKLGRGESI
jgi:hypothetical protein